MNGKHWTRKDAIEHLYGIGPDAVHLDECADCRSMTAELEAQRRRSAAEPEISPEFLAAQRRAIYRKLGREPRQRSRLAPAFVVAFLVLIALLVGRNTWFGSPAPLVTSSDSQLFSEIYALEQDSEPQAAQTVKAMFEETP